MTEVRSAVLAVIFQTVKRIAAVMEMTRDIMFSFLNVLNPRWPSQLGSVILC